MASSTAKRIERTEAVSANNDDDGQSISEKIKDRQSKDLIIGFCGAIGSGIKSIVETSAEELKSLGYETFHIRISNLFKNLPDYPASKIKSSYDRYLNLQEFGDSLRHRYGKDILAQAAIKEIAVEKTRALTANRHGKKAFLIDQIKNPSEVALFRLVYQNNFYLVGTLRTEEQRKRNLRDESISPANIDELIHRDRKSNTPQGQHTEKAILDSDFFINNDQSHKKQLRDKVSRFLGLVHGKNGLTPSFHEKGMYAAFSASLQSACLSRQVGAAIYNEQGDLLVIGKNDVPKSGGGLYEHEDQSSDYRCIHKGGKCYNDLHKQKIKSKIQSLLTSFSSSSEEKFKISESISNELSNYIYDNTGISSIIEYSRSIHAEMDAITSLARHSKQGSKDTILFSTTFPCHNCARHIVASGIKKVIYIEPYEKSLALDLHDDAITKTNEDQKVVFELFEGIPPRRYQKFFLPKGERKNSSGLSLSHTVMNDNHIDIQFLDSYEDYEAKVTEIYDRNLRAS